MRLSVPAGNGLLVCTFSIDTLEVAPGDVGFQVVASVLDRRGVVRFTRTQRWRTRI